MTPEEYVQEELKHYKFCPICAAVLEAEMGKSRRYSLVTNRYEDTPETVKGKKCPNGCGEFDVNYHTTFSRNTDVPDGEKR